MQPLGFSFPAAQPLVMGMHQEGMPSPLPPELFPPNQGNALVAREGWDLLWGRCIRMLMSSPHLACLLHAPSASSQPTAPLPPLPSPQAPAPTSPGSSKGQGR